MGTHRKLLSLIMWCSIVLHKNVSSQGYYYKRGNVNAYQLINGRFQPLTTTTPQPGLLETLFPWTGNAYDSVKSAEEDAAILNSLADIEVTSSSVSPMSMEGLLSWLPIPSLPGFSLPSFLPETSGDNPLQAAYSMQFPNAVMPNPTPNAPPPPNPNENGNFNDMPLAGAQSIAHPVVVPGPGQDNQIQMTQQQQQQQQQPLPGQMPGQQQQQQQMAGPQQQQPGPQYAIPSGNQIPQEIRNNLNPTFQFHQQIKDSIPIPTPNFPGLNQPMFPYPYSAPSTPDFMKSTPEKTASFLDFMSNYFTFGKRSDLEHLLNQGKIMDARSGEEGQAAAEDDSSDEEEEVEDPGYNFDFEATREALEKQSEKDFLCPKSGIWRWNGEVCIAVGPVPVWACRPNDLVVSGKIAICRNKIYFSPKVINNLHE